MRPTARERLAALPEPLAQALADLVDLVSGIDQGEKTGLATGLRHDNPSARPEFVSVLRALAGVVDEVNTAAEPAAHREHATLNRAQRRALTRQGEADLAAIREQLRREHGDHG